MHRFQRKSARGRFFRANSWRGRRNENFSYRQSEHTRSREGGMDQRHCRSWSNPVRTEIRGEAVNPMNAMTSEQATMLIQYLKSLKAKKLTSINYTSETKTVLVR